LIRICVVFSDAFKEDIPYILHLRRSSTNYEAQLDRLSRLVSARGSCC